MSDSQYVVFSLPFQPRDSIGNPFYYMTAIAAEYLADFLHTEYKLGINTMHSYKTYAPETIASFAEMFSWIRHSLYVDSDFASQLSSVVYELLCREKIKVRESSLLTCTCGRVEIDETIRDVWGKGQIIDDHGEMKCSCCGSVLYRRTEISLFWKVDEVEMCSFPTYVDKDCNHFRSAYKDAWMRISRIHSTGICVIVNGQIFNLDIDFVWKCIPLLASEKPIVVASSKHIFEMYCIAVLGKQLGKDVYFVSVPYIQGVERIIPILDKADGYNLLRATCLLGPDWNKKVCPINEGRFRYIYRNIQPLWECMTRNNQKNISSWDEIRREFQNSLNFQRRVKEMKGEINERTAHEKLLRLEK
ncbi:MAG: hypothetical protein HUJ69_01365 [Lachnospiraceae bacterium]|nr:hypothetical protein [Lachnospiraceae bacterium]